MGLSLGVLEGVRKLWISFRTFIVTKVGYTLLDKSNFTEEGNQELDEKVAGKVVHVCM
jgi:hypothetical protein